MTAAGPRDLYNQLRDCQRRLGTSAEQPGDFDRALQLAHDINNEITAHYLRAAAESLPPVSPSLVSVSRRVLGR